MNYPLWRVSRFFTTVHRLIFLTRFYFVLFRYVLPGIALSCFVLPSYAGTSLTIKQALKKTLQNNVELQLYPLIIRGSEALELQAEVTPLARFDVKIENSLGTGIYEGFDASEISLSYGQIVELGNKQLSRKQFASDKTNYLKQEYQISRLDILAETSRRFFKNILIQEKLSLIAKRMEIEQKALTAIQQRAKAGAAKQADVSKMRLRVGHSKMQEMKLTSELEIAQKRLSAMWVSEPEFESVSGSMIALPAIPSRKLLIEVISELPRYQLQLAQQRVADSRLLLAQSNGAGNLDFAIGIKQHQQSSDQSLNFSFSMPLAFKNPNRGRIKAARMQLEQSEMQLGSIKRSLKLTMLNSRHRLLSLTQQHNMAETHLLPQAQRLLAETEKGFRVGHYSVLQWIDAQSELFSIQLKIAELRIHIFNQYVELERVVGRSLATETQQLETKQPETKQLDALNEGERP